MPVRMVRLRCSPGWGWWSAIRVIAWRMARVTPARARSDADAALAVSTAQANGAGEFSQQEVAFGVGLGRSLGFPACLCLLDVVVDFGEASSVCVLGLRVEHLARVAQCRSRQASRVVIVVVGDAAGLGSDQIQHVEFAGWVGEEPGEVVHAFEVAYADGVTVEDHCPVVTFASKDVDAARLLVEGVAVCDLGCRGNRRRGFDLVKDRAGRLAL